MNNCSQQSGFSLVTAIFLLAVLAVLMANLVSLGIGQQAAVVMGLQGSRALQAARSGLEFGIYRALVESSCRPSQVINIQSGGLQDFTVSLTCDVSTHTEGAQTINVYRLEATATHGNYIQGSAANPDYVSRVLHATVSDGPV